MIDGDIAAHDDLGLEDARLGAGGTPRLEYLRTMELLERFLPSACDVLDVGGGTGVYAGVLDDPVFLAIVEQDLIDGQHRNPDVVGNPAYFTTAFFHLPAELEAEVVEAGFDEVSLHAVEGPGWLLEGRPVDLEQLLTSARLAETDAALMPTSAHFLAAARPAA